MGSSVGLDVNVGTTVGSREGSLVTSGLGRSVFGVDLVGANVLCIFDGVGFKV